MANETVIIDLQNYKDTSGGRVEPGEYVVTVEDTEVTESKAGNPMIVLFLRVTGGEYDGITLIDRLPQTSKALFRTVAFMQALGLPTPKKRFKINTGKFLNKRVLVTVDDGEPYQGRVKSEVRGYSRMTSGRDAVADADEADLDEEDVSEEPTDYDEDQEPEKVELAKAKKSKKAKKAKPAPEPKPENQDDDSDHEDEDDEIDLDEVEL